MKITIENVVASRTKFNNVLSTIVNECRSFSPNVFITLNNVTLDADDPIVTLDKGDTDVFEDLLDIRSLQDKLAEECNSIAELESSKQYFDRTD